LCKKWGGGEGSKLSCYIKSLGGGELAEKPDQKRVLKDTKRKKNLNCYILWRARGPVAGGCKKKWDEKNYWRPGKIAVYNIKNKQIIRMKIERWVILQVLYTFSLTEDTHLPLKTNTLTQKRPMLGSRLQGRIKGDEGRKKGADDMDSLPIGLGGGGAESAKW